MKIYKKLYFLSLIIGVLLISCSKDSEKQLEDFEFWKINIVTPNPQRTIDSLINKYNLHQNSNISEQNGFVSGSLDLANASIQVKTYLDTAQHKPGPTEITILTSLPDSIAYKKLKDRGLEVNKPFRRDGWDFSVITIPDLKILGEKSNGIYICRFDGDKEDMIENAKWRDSIRNTTEVRLDAINIFAPNAQELEENWNKLKLNGENCPKFNFITDNNNRMEIEIK